MILTGLKAAGLMLVTGPALFAAIFSIFSPNYRIPGDLYRISIKVTFMGVVLYVLSFLGYLLIDQGYFEPGIDAINLILVPIFVFFLTRFNQPGDKKFSLTIVAISLLIFNLHIINSNTGFDSGIYPYLSMVVHIMVTAVWTGGAVLMIYKLVTIGNQAGQGDIAELKQMGFKLFKMSVVLLILLLITGAILMVNNVHDSSVMDFTVYGGYLKTKLYLVLIIISLLLTGIIKSKKLFIYTQGSESMSGDGFVRRSRIYNLLQILIIASIVMIAGMLSRVEPPNIAPFLNPQSWHISIAQQNVRIDMQPVAGSVTDVRFEIFLPEALMQRSPVFINFDLYMPDTQIGIYGNEALQVTQTSYQGEAVFPVPGIWQFDLNINLSDGSTISGSLMVEIPAQPLVKDLRTYLSFWAIQYSTSNTVTFLVGIGLILIYGWLMKRSQINSLDVRLALIGLAGISLGVFLVMSIVLVKTYPSTYWRNPQTYNAMSINEGRINYLEHCAECHGDSGGGDGPWSIDNRGRIPALFSPHMDIHTDGEIYWWISYGIPSLDMTAVDQAVSDDIRWSIINYIRSLRHGIPAQ